MPLTLKAPPYGEMELTPEFIEAVLDAAHQTTLDGKERGVVMCLTADGTRIKPGGTCAGSVCSIHQPGETCGFAQMEIGFLHTHPRGHSSNWSVGDAMAILYRSPKDLVHVGCRTGFNPAGYREMRCEIPSWLPTRETENELESLYSNIRKLYAEWEMTEQQPPNGRWEVYDRMKEKLSPVIKNIAIAPVPQLYEEHHYNRGRECAAQMGRAAELRAIAEEAAKTKLGYGDGLQCRRIREIRDLATEMRQRAETAPTTIIACRDAIQELGYLEMYAAELLRQATCSVLEEQ